MKYVWIFATIGAIAAGVWVWRGRDRAPAARPDAPAASGTATPAPPAPAVDAGGVAVAPSPSLPVPAQPGTPAPPGPDPAPAAGADSLPFDREARDPSWAVDQERELKVRMTHVRELLSDRGAKVDVVAAECRATQCRLSIAAGAEADLSALYGVLESPDGLYGWADAVVLGQIDRDPATGGLTTEVTAVFEREE
ncbi:MAG: hypothetical protein JNK64_15345 [Myxococcales bacterium]|nr:hypothetical protein [Myxococcales bacterium]